MLVPVYLLFAALAIAIAIFAFRRPPVAPTGKLRRWIWGTIALLSLGLAVLFAFAYYDHYWRWRDCFNELGRCYDPQTQMVFLEQAGIVWGGMTAMALVAAVMFLAIAWRR